MAPVWATQQLGIRKGAWTPEEDALLTKCIDKYGEGKWRHVPLRAGLNRCRKSCRLRWLNYLRPSIKRGEFAPDEVDLIIKLHRLLGSRWSLIAGRIPGRTANDIKNYWNCHLSKKLAAENDQGRTSKVIKPKPRTLAVKSGGLMGCHGAFPNASSKQVHMDDKSNPIVSDNDLDWWKRLIDEESRNLGSPNAYGEQLKASPQAEDKGGMASDGDPYAFLEGEIDWDGLFLDVDLRGSLEANGEGTAI